MGWGSKYFAKARELPRGTFPGGCVLPTAVFLHGVLVDSNVVAWDPVQRVVAVGSGGSGLVKVFGGAGVEAGLVGGDLGSGTRFLQFVGPGAGRLWRVSGNNVVELYDLGTLKMVAARQLEFTASAVCVTHGSDSLYVGNEHGRVDVFLSRAEPGRGWTLVRTSYSIGAAETGAEAAAQAALALFGGDDDGDAAAAAGGGGGRGEDWGGGAHGAHGGAGDHGGGFGDRARSSSEITRRNATLVASLAPRPAHEGRPAGAHLLVGYRCGLVVLWSVKDRRPLASFSSGVASGGAALISCVWHPAGTHFACGHTGGVLSLWSAGRSNSPLRILRLGPSSSMGTTIGTSVLKMAWAAETFSSRETLYVHGGGRAGEEEVLRAVQDPLTAPADDASIPDGNEAARSSRVQFIDFVAGASGLCHCIVVEDGVLDFECMVVEGGGSGGAIVGQAVGLLTRGGKLELHDAWAPSAPRAPLCSSPGTVSPVLATVLVSTVDHQAAGARAKGTRFAHELAALCGPHLTAAVSGLVLSEFPVTGGRRPTSASFGFQGTPTAPVRVAATGHLDGSVRVWNASNVTLQLLASVPTGLSRSAAASPVMRVCLCPVAGILLAATLAGEVLVFQHCAEERNVHCAVIQPGPGGSGGLVRAFLPNRRCMAGFQCILRAMPLGGEGGSNPMSAALCTGWARAAVGYSTGEVLLLDLASATALCCSAMPAGTSASAGSTKEGEEPERSAVCGLAFAPMRTYDRLDPKYEPGEHPCDRDALPGLVAALRDSSMHILDAADGRHISSIWHKNPAGTVDVVPLTLMGDRCDVRPREIVFLWTAPTAARPGWDGTPGGSTLSRTASLSSPMSVADSPVSTSTEYFDGIGMRGGGEGATPVSRRDSSAAGGAAGGGAGYYGAEAWSTIENAEVLEERKTMIPLSLNSPLSCWDDTDRIHACLNTRARQKSEKEVRRSAFSDVFADDEVWFYHACELLLHVQDTALRLHSVRSVLQDDNTADRKRQLVAGSGAATMELRYCMAVCGHLQAPPSAVERERKREERERSAAAEAAGVAPEDDKASPQQPWGSRRRCDHAVATLDGEGAVRVYSLPDLEPVLEWPVPVATGEMGRSFRGSSAAARVSSVARDGTVLYVGSGGRQLLLADLFGDSDMKLAMSSNVPCVHVDRDGSATPPSLVDRISSGISSMMGAGDSDGGGGATPAGAPPKKSSSGNSWSSLWSSMTGASTAPLAAAAGASAAAPSSSSSPAARPHASSSDQAESALFAGAAGNTSQPRSMRARRQADGVNAEMAQTRDKLLERGERLNSLQNKTAALRDESKSFADLAEELKRSQRGGW